MRLKAEKIIKLFNTLKDETNRKILMVLMREGRLYIKQIAEKVGFSDSWCLRKLQDLERSGLVESEVVRKERKQVYYEFVDQEIPKMKVSELLRLLKLEGSK